MLIAWLYARQVDASWRRRKILGRAAGLMAVVAIVSGILLHLCGLRAVWESGARM